MSDTDPRKSAIILSGGGANGAYEVGVLKALFAGKVPQVTGAHPLDPRVFCGTSVGAYNAAFLVSKWDGYGEAAISGLEKVWHDELADTPQAGGSGVYRFRINPMEYVDPRWMLFDPVRPFTQFFEDNVTLFWDAFDRIRNFFTIKPERPQAEQWAELFNASSFVSSRPFERMLKKTIEFKSIRDCQKRLRIAATNWHTGDLKIYENQHMTDQFGGHVIRASAAIPGFFPPVSVGSQAFVDGGVLLNTPLDLALDVPPADKPAVLHVIYLNPPPDSIPLTGVENTLTTVYRTQIIAWQRAVNNDIEGYASVNAALKFGEQIAEGIEPSDADEAKLFTALRKMGLHHRGRDRERYRKLDIHRYYPSDDLGGSLGLLNFKRNRIERLIERGFNDACNHRCDKNGCVLTEGPQRFI